MLKMYFLLGGMNSVSDFMQTWGTSQAVATGFPITNPKEALFESYHWKIF